MENKQEKCKDCVIALYEGKKVFKSQIGLLKLIPWYNLDKVEIYKKCPVCNFTIT